MCYRLLPLLDYYLLIKDRQAGPYAIEQLRHMWAGGLVTLDMLFWREGMPEWLQLRTITDEMEARAPASEAAVTPASDGVVQPTTWRRTPPPRPRRRSSAKVLVAAILLGVLAAGGGVYFIRAKAGGRAGWSKAADTELRRCLRDFVTAGVQLDSMSRQDTNSLAFGWQLEVAITAFEFPSQSWPPHFAPQAREEFEAALRGWRLLQQIRQLHVGESYNATNNARLVAALEAYAPGRIEYDPNPEHRGFIPFEPNIATLLKLASGHFAAGCGHLEKYYGK